MKIQIRDVVSLSGRDYVVEGLVSTEVAGRTSIAARAVDGRDVLWIESPQDLRDAAAAKVGSAGSAGSTAAAAYAPSDRLLVLHEIRDLDLSAPPPESINYHGVPYVLRLAGRATRAVIGVVPERTTGTAQLWRYHSAGDLYLQIEEENGRLFKLAGQTVLRGMIDLLPGH